MELEPDPYRLSKLDGSYREERSGAWWVIVILLGVLFGNILSFGAYKLYVRWELHQMAIAAAEVMKEQTERMRVEREIRAQESAIQRRKREKQSAANYQLRQTCQFWKQQVSNENTSQNRAYRDAACARASGAYR